MGSNNFYTKIRKRFHSVSAKRWLLTFGLAIGFGTALFLAFKSYKDYTASAMIYEQDKLGCFPIETPTLRYGFVLDTFDVAEGTIQANQTLADLLLPFNISYPTIDQLVKKSEEIFDVRHIRTGKEYAILAKDSVAQYMIYEPNVFKYVVFDLTDSTKTYVVNHPVETKIREASGVIVSSLWQTMVDNGLSYGVTSKMEDIFAWSVDFHHVQKNDRFKLIFEEQYIDGEAVGVGAIKAAHYQDARNSYYAFYYENDKYQGFYDEKGRPMKKAFLKAPVKYSRISSAYNPRRFHPILKRVRPHLGTDYAAPYGTPIYAVGNGVVTKAGYTRGNGNYVKIKHDDVYQTQYLHMQKFARGITPGVQVKQGEVIGYVGSTGLATGPHVCFRFWKNGRQVDHRRQNLPPPEPMDEAELPKFFKVKDALKSQIDAIKWAEIQEEDKLSEKEEEQKKINKEQG